MSDFDTNVFAVPCLDGGGNLTGSLIACEDHRAAAVDCTCFGEWCPECTVDETPKNYEVELRDVQPCVCTPFVSGQSYRVEIIDGQDLNGTFLLTQRADNACRWTFDRDVSIRMTTWQSNDCTGEPLSIDNWDFVQYLLTPTPVHLEWTVVARIGRMRFGQPFFLNVDFFVGRFTQENIGDCLFVDVVAPNDKVNCQTPSTIAWVDGLARVNWKCT